MSAPKQSQQEKIRQELADKQALIENTTELARSLSQQLQSDDWQTSLCVRQPSSGIYVKQAVYILDEAAHVYVTSHGGIVEPARYGQHPVSRRDMDHYWSINWRIRSLDEVTAIHTALQAVADTTASSE